MKKIKVKETKHYCGDMEGDLGRIISSLQQEKNEGWEGIEKETEYDYGYPSAYTVFYLYKYREETDEEYNKRIEIQKQTKAKQEAMDKERYEELKKKFGDS